LSQDELNEVDERPVTCEEKLKAAEVQLMLNRADGQQVRQHQLAYNEAVKDIQELRVKIKTLENEITSLRQAGAHNTNAMKEYMELIENLDFKVESARLRYIIQFNEHFYLRFDRNGQMKHAYAPEEYNALIKQEWDSINAS
jgi:Xaa-Pro aminopeptidase